MFAREKSPCWEGRVRLPLAWERARLAQAEEWCDVLDDDDDQWSRIRLQDYGPIFERPGLYEYIFHDLMECDSPRRVIDLLDAVRVDLEVPANQLRVLDLGAGNGIVAERLAGSGAAAIMGIDILRKAEEAADRDRPGLYQDYLVADLSSVSTEARSRIVDFRPTALACVAALGFGDIPTRVYMNALSFIPDGGLLAFNIKSAFLEPQYSYGFSLLIRRMVDEKVVRVEAMRRYRHRLGVDGKPLYYTAMIATKLAALPEHFVREVEQSEHHRRV